MNRVPDDPMRHRGDQTLPGYREAVESRQADYGVHMAHGHSTIRRGQLSWDQNEHAEAGRYWRSARSAFEAAERAAGSDQYAQLAEAQCGIALATAQLARLEADTSILLQQAIALLDLVIGWLSGVEQVDVSHQLAMAHTLSMQLYSGSWCRWPWEPDREEASKNRMAAFSLLEDNQLDDGGCIYRYFLFKAAEALIASPYPNDVALGGSYLRDARRSARTHRAFGDFWRAVKLLWHSRKVRKAASQAEGQSDE